ncbi:GGDEF domain-containing protein [Pseudothermotoga sp.]
MSFLFAIFLLSLLLFESRMDKNRILLVLRSADLLVRVVLCYFLYGYRQSFIKLGATLLVFSRSLSIAHQLVELPLVDWSFELIDFAGMTFITVSLLWQLRDFITEEFYKLIYLDSLTNALNRHAFFKIARKILKSKRSASIVYIDLNKFKEVNDRFGHMVGDRVLEIVYKRLKSVIKEHDLLARIGGDEFVALLPGANRSQAVQVVQRMSERFCNPISIMNTTIQIGMSAGIAVFPEDGETLEELLKKADENMYKAKKVPNREGEGCSTR